MPVNIYSSDAWIQKIKMKNLKQIQNYWSVTQSTTVSVSKHHNRN